MPPQFVCFAPVLRPSGPLVSAFPPVSPGLGPATDGPPEQIVPTLPLRRGGKNTTNWKCQRAPRGHRRRVRPNNPGFARGRESERTGGHQKEANGDRNLHLTPPRVQLMPWKQWGGGQKTPNQEAKEHQSLPGQFFFLFLTPTNFQSDELFIGAASLHVPLFGF